MLSTRWLLALFGLLILTSGITYADDAADGEIHEESEESSTDTTDDGKVGHSPDAHVTLLFTDPKNVIQSSELIAGKLTKFLIGFANRGEKDFYVHFSHTSFRYPLDFNYHIQNFTAAQYQKVVPPKQEATFDFAFIPHESFIGRPLGLVVNLHYSDADGASYITTALNQTVTIQEDDSVFQAEYYFLILTGIGFVVLLLLIGQNLLSRFTRKQSRPRPVQELGTNSSDLDFEWIPKEITEKKSPKTGSPRQRRPVKAN